MCWSSILPSALGESEELTMTIFMDFRGSSLAAIVGAFPVLIDQAMRVYVLVKVTVKTVDIQRVEIK